MSYVILIGCPDSWSETQVTMMADRLIADSLPGACSVAYAIADLVEVPYTAKLLRRLGDDE